VPPFSPSSVHQCQSHELPTPAFRGTILLDAFFSFPHLATVGLDLSQHARPVSQTPPHPRAKTPPPPAACYSTSLSFHKRCPAPPWTMRARVSFKDQILPFYPPPFDISSSLLLAVLPQSRRTLGVRSSGLSSLLQIGSRKTFHPADRIFRLSYSQHAPFFPGFIRSFLKLPVLGVQVDIHSYTSSNLNCQREVLGA